jgi:hypothetical protein
VGQARREHETRIKEKYGLRSLDYLIQESNQKILDYQLRQAAGDNVDLPLRNEQRNLETLQQRRALLEQEIVLERSVTVSEPRIIGVAVVPGLRTRMGGMGGLKRVRRRFCVRSKLGYGVGEGVDAERKREIELVGMAVAYGMSGKTAVPPKTYPAKITALTCARWPMTKMALCRYPLY